MQIKIDLNLASVQQALRRAADQVPFATSVAINKTVELARVEVVKTMRQVFDRPTPWVLNSLRVKRSTKTSLTADLGFKDRNSAESSRSMIEPHVFAGKRHNKAMEARLFRMGLLPAGYSAVPGKAAKIDSFGNMSQGQITTILNVLGTYTEAGYNKANSNTVARFKRGNVKKNVYGFTYFVSPVGGAKGRHLQPGVYQRFQTAFGTSLKPVLIFVKQPKYKKTLPFFEVAQRTVNQEFPGQFNKAFDAAMKTALVKTQPNLL